MRVGLVIFAVLCAIVAAALPTGSERLSIDAVTGSLRHELRNFVGRPRTRSEPPPLERRLVTADIAWNADWRLMSERESGTLLGDRRSIACATAPPIYAMRPVLSEACDATTDAQLRAFVATMQSRNEASITAAVNEAIDQMLAPRATAS